VEGVLSAVGGNQDASQIWVAYAAAAKVARDRIWITQSYFAPDEELLAAIREAAARGVDVRILVAGFSDSDLLLNASRAYYGDLLEAGVSVFESQEHILHAKTMVVDGMFSVFGTSNLDARSSQINEEIEITVHDEGFGREMEAVFDNDLRRSRRYTLEEFKKRSAWEGLTEWVAIPFRSQL
jgi:cardiolipin synthase